MEKTLLKRGGIDLLCHLVKYYEIIIIKVIYYCHGNRQIHKRGTVNIGSIKNFTYENGNIKDKNEQKGII